jgi:hypothetical protein
VAAAGLRFAPPLRPHDVEPKEGNPKLKKLSMLVWLVPAVLTPYLLIRGIWALQQPWGVQSQIIGGLVFFFILWIVSLYLLFAKTLAKNLNLTAREEEKRKWTFHAIGSAAFVLGGIFLITIKPENWGIGSLSVVFFGLCLLNAIRQYMKT